MWTCSSSIGIEMATLKLKRLSQVQRRHRSHLLSVWATLHKTAMLRRLQNGVPKRVGPDCVRASMSCPPPSRVAFGKSSRLWLNFSVQVFEGQHQNQISILHAIGGWGEQSQMEAISRGRQVVVFNPMMPLRLSKHVLVSFRDTWFCFV